MEMHFLMANSGIPSSKQSPIILTPTKEDIDAFVCLREIKDDVFNFVANGESLYLHSQNFGNGKTSWAIKILQSYFDRVWAGNGFRCRGIFVHVPSLLNKIKDNFNNNDEEFVLLKNLLITVDLVVWDDVAAAKLSDFDHSVLLSFIDQRKLNDLSNIYTGNLGLKELPSAIGNRLTSRIWNDSTIIELVGIDRRHTR
jgi:DNA replication protein DnaC